MQKHEPPKDSNSFERIDWHANQIVQEALALGFVGGIEEAHRLLMQTAHRILDTFREVAVPEEVTFWYHAESEGLLTTYGMETERVEQEPLAEPVSVERYRAIQKQLAEEREG